MGHPGQDRCSTTALMACRLKPLATKGFMAALGSISGLALLALPLCASAAPPVLSLPIQCHLGVDCHIQNYVDRDAGSGWRDYTCGSLSYDGHSGTDFRLPDLASMQAGVNVLAASAGTVAAVRDGEPDLAVSWRGRAALNGKDAGNTVRITHADGWETQYSHLKRGSVRVRAGQQVAAGAVLGQVGLSGKTEFPHVDFAVRHHGVPVDPFAPNSPGCGQVGENRGENLWDAALAPALAYRPTGVLVAGFAPVPPERDTAQAGGYATAQIQPDSPALIFWMELFGLQQGDVLELTLTGPDETPVAASRSVAAGNKAVWFAFAGKRRSAHAWPPGSYAGRVILRRGDRIVIDAQRSTAIVRQP